MEQLRIASPTPRLDAEYRAKDSAPIFAHHLAIRCSGRDRNWRRGHSRSLSAWHANQGVDANRLNVPTKSMREVLADDSYRDHRANVQTMHETNCIQLL